MAEFKDCEYRYIENEQLYCKNKTEKEECCNCKTIICCDCYYERVECPMKPVMVEDNPLRI